MSLRSRLDRLLDLGPADDPRRVAVAATRKRVERPVTSTPGARLRIERSGADGEVLRLLLWCHRRAVPVELVEAEVDQVWLDGARVSPADARKVLGGR